MHPSIIIQYKWSQSTAQRHKLKENKGKEKNKIKQVHATITILNIYATNRGAHNFITEMLVDLKPHTSHNTVIDSG